MIDISIQIRKVTDKVKQYYSLFGYSTFTQFSSSYSKVNGIKRMGFEEIECVISDTAHCYLCHLLGANFLKKYIGRDSITSSPPSYWVERASCLTLCLPRPKTSKAAGRGALQWCLPQPWFGRSWPLVCSAVPWRGVKLMSFRSLNARVYFNVDVVFLRGDGA